MKPTNQDQLFAAFEGNNWFRRNRKVLKRLDSETDLPWKLLEMYEIWPRKVLEIGAATFRRRSQAC